MADDRYCGVTKFKAFSLTSTKKNQNLEVDLTHFHEYIKNIHPRYIETVLRMARHFLLLCVTAASVQGFVAPTVSVSPSVGVLDYRSRLCFARRSQAHDEISAEDMRKDIEEMRQEAMKRIAALNEKFKTEEDLARTQNKEDAVDSSKATEEDNAPTTVHSSDAEMLDMIDAEQEALVRKNSVSDQPTITATPPRHLKLMDDTRWRLMLNVGREPGTWMPQTWGISGKRLYLNLELEFSPDQLYEREDFLNGIAGTKVLKVVHNEANLSPTMTEGGRKVRVKDGGWRVASGEGPFGTTVLRFYFDLEEKTIHSGSDVYCPAGRIYCTCGYFPMDQRQHDGSSLRDVLKQEHDRIVAQYESLSAENERDENLVSWGKLQRGKKMMDLRMQANQVGQKMNEAAVQEPERRLLRLSQDQSVGLTKEGGVCCKVQKGVAIEYHILGKFEIASMENREHKDYRELLA